MANTILSDMIMNRLVGLVYVILSMYGLLTWQTAHVIIPISDCFYFDKACIVNNVT